MVAKSKGTCKEIERAFQSFYIPLLAFQPYLLLSSNKSRLQDLVRAHLLKANNSSASGRFRAGKYWIANRNKMLQHSLGLISHAALRIGPAFATACRLRAQGGRSWWKKLRLHRATDRRQYFAYWSYHRTCEHLQFLCSARRLLVHGKQGISPSYHLNPNNVIRPGKAARISPGE